MVERGLGCILPGENSRRGAVALDGGDRDAS
jgi:hypothetical protein